MKTKRFLAALLAAIMTFTCLGVVAFAALPTGAMYDDDMDSEGYIYEFTNKYGTYKSPMPNGWTDRLKRGFPTGFAVKGKSGEAGDKAFQWCIGVGKAGRSDVKGGISTKLGWINGIDISVGSDAIADTTFAYDADFKIGSKTIWAQLITPSFGGKYPIALAVYDGNIVIQSVPVNQTTLNNINTFETVGKMEIDKWYNIGAVINHSSTSGLKIDFYVDSEKVYTYTSTATAYKKSGVTAFSIPGESISTKADAERYQDRGEYITVDNFYIGEDISRVKPDFKVEEVIPAGDSVVPVDQEFSVVLNQATVNAANVPNAIWLTQKDGTRVDFATIINEATNVDKDTLTGQLGEDLFYSEEYTLSQSNQLVNAAGKKLTGKQFTYTTKSMFPVTAEVSYTKSSGTASATVTFTGNTEVMKAVMAAYDENGALVDYDVKDVAANASDVSLEVSYLDNETIKIFALDGFDTANLLMEPIIDGEKAKSYKQKNTTVSLDNVTTMNQVITVEGTTNSVRGWVVTKIADKGNEDSSDITDYLSIDAVQADDSGEFKFAGRVVTNSGTYTYKAIAADSKAYATGETEYVLGTDTDIISLKLAGKNARKDGDTFYLALKDVDASGLLVEFTLPYKATLLCNGKLLTSGKSRINCDDVCVLEVKPEYGESKFYNVIVDVEITDDYDDRNDNFTVITDKDYDAEGENVVDPGEWEDPTRVFTDVPKSHWAMEAIEALYEMGVVGGKGDGTFDPNALITREEFASMVSKAFGYSPKNTRISFDDVPWGVWYEDAVYALAENGIVAGIEKHKFGTGLTITRQDMAVILYNVIKDGSIDYVRDYKDFADQSKIASYAQEAVKVMYEAGYVNGMEDGTFAPTAGTTKAMAAYMIYSIMN